jgi:hypothetical protein
MTLFDVCCVLRVPQRLVVCIPGRTGHWQELLGFKSANFGKPEVNPHDIKYDMAEYLKPNKLQ